MTGFIFMAVLGLFCIFIGVLNMRGNISTVHFYHRRRVSEADRIPFGRLIGLGTIICGIAICIFSIFSAVDYLMTSPILTLVGTVFLIVGMAVGFVLNIYAMIKYNKGLF